MKKRIWIVGHYTMPPEHEVRIKTLMWAKYLMAAGYEVILISASTLHNTDINLIQDNQPYVEKYYDDYHFFHIRCDQYHGSGISRIKNLMQFSHRFKKYAKNFGPLPDVILAADIHCVNYKPVADFAKKNKIHFIIDIRDLWPESIVEYLGFSKNNPIIHYLYQQEKKMYTVADDIVFSMEGGKQYIIDRGWDIGAGGSVDVSKVHHINNGIVLSDFEYNSEHYQIDDEELSNTDKFKVVYIGSIRKANNISMIVDTAQELKNRKNENILILVYGDGDKREELETRCKKEKLDNIVFKGLVDKKYIPFVLSCCDLNLMHGAPMKLGRYGVSLNKSFDYLASGKPTITDIVCNYDYMVNSGSSLEVECNYKTITEGIIQIQSLDEEEYHKICACARMSARQYDFSVLTEKLIKIIEE